MRCTSPRPEAPGLSWVPWNPWESIQIHGNRGKARGTPRPVPFPRRRNREHDYLRARRAGTGSDMTAVPYIDGKTGCQFGHNTTKSDILPTRVVYSTAPKIWGGEGGGVNPRSGAPPSSLDAEMLHTALGDIRHAWQGAGPAKLNKEVRILESRTNVRTQLIRVARKLFSVRPLSSQQSMPTNVAGNLYRIQTLFNWTCTFRTKCAEPGTCTLLDVTYVSPFRNNTNMNGWAVLQPPHSC
eukprot:gene19001-biopygen12993